MKKPIKTIVTIGDGVSAWCLNWYLAREGSFRVINIAANNFLTPCSFKTTSTVGKRGTTRGVSELGEKILDSQILFEDFVKDFAPNGIYKGREFHLWVEAKREKFLRRYNEEHSTKEEVVLSSILKRSFSFVENSVSFIDPLELRSWFYQTIYGEFEQRKGFVTEIKKLKNNQVRIKTMDSFVDCDAVICCTSHSSKALLEGFDEKFDYYINHSKQVAGSYLEIDLDELDFSFPKSMNLKIENNQLLYRKESGVLQIGSTNDNQSGCLLANEKSLREIYSFFVENLDLSFPDFENFTTKAGVRHKGFQRLPFWGEVTKNIYSICGLYKNAFTFSFLASEHILKELNKK